MKKRISIIIPVYNVEKYLRQCLDSVINQTYREIEIILIDDGSTDNSGKICDEYAKKDKRIKVIHQENKDISASRNTGLKVATGEFIGYIDSDDYVELDMYEKLYNLIEDTGSDFAVCNRYIGNEEGKRVKNNRFPKKKLITKKEALEEFYRGMYVRNKLYKKNIIEDIDFIGTYAEDVGYNFRVILNSNKIACINECFYYYRFNPKSRLHTKKFNKTGLSYIDFLDKEIAYCEENNLLELKRNLKNTRTGIASAWLYYLCFERNPNQQIIKSLIKVVRENIFQYVFFNKNTSLEKKVFALTSCLNYSFSKAVSKCIGMGE